MHSVTKINITNMELEYSLPPIKNQQLLQLALTHRSYANENPEVGGHNERLEFLGDAVLGFLVGEMLYRLYPEMNEAELTRLRSCLVDETQLGRIAEQMNLGAKMRLGVGAAKDNGRDNPSLLNDTFEAIMGAYYLDAGINALSIYIQPLFQALAAELIAESAKSEQSSLIDSKNRLQQWALAHHKETPKYQIIAESGLDNQKEFTAQVSVKGIVYGIGKGKRKKTAEKQAAIAALEKLS
jgi:ribonuclease III